MYASSEISCRIARSLAAALLILCAGQLPASADAGSFLRAIEGSWQGQGIAQIPGRDDQERISCKVDNTYDSEKSALVVNGKCATTQSRSNVQGRIAHDGDNVTGALIGSFDGATITKSGGSVNGDRLVVSTNFMDNATGNLTRTQQVIRRTARGFDAAFYTFDNATGGFVKAGSISFAGR